MIPFNDYLRAGAAIVLCASLVSPPALADRSDDTVTVAAPWKIGVLTPAATGTVLQRMGVTEPLTPAGPGRHDRRPAGGRLDGRRDTHHLALPHPARRGVP